jgi:hypothetical protein
MRYHALIVAALVAASSAIAQQTSWSGPEIRPFIGAYLPAGAIRTDFKSATMVGAQGAYEPTRHLHVIGTIGWAHGHSRAATLTSDGVSIWQYDLGLEFNIDRPMKNDWKFQPFLGAGAGGRTYDYKASSASTSSCVSGYAATGAQLQRSALAWRFEGRDYLSCYESPLTGKERVRNDFTVMLGAAWHFR